MTELLFSTAFTLWGLDTSWLELIAVLLAFAMIVCNIVAAGLFAWKGLWLTTLLYLAFIALSAVGWRTWAKHAQVETA